MLLAIRLIDGRYIEQGLISAGMFKTMIVLATSMFSSPHALLVYDGIESGLDKDCLSCILVLYFMVDAETCSSACYCQP